MRTSNNIEIVKKLQQEKLSLFTLADFCRLFGVANQQTVYKKIQRLEQKGVIKRLIKGKYIFLLEKPNEFEIANFLRQPSYVSLESALSFYGIIAGFPHQTTSVTTKKTKLYVFEGKDYQYAQINPNLFWGYEKKENFLIADKEKSLIDFLYLAHKGWRIISLDKLKGQFDLTEIDKSRFKDYCQMVKNKHFLKFLKQVSL